MNTALVVLGLVVGTVAVGAGLIFVARRLIAWVKKYRALAAEYALYGHGADEVTGAWFRIWLGELIDGVAEPSHAKEYPTLDSGQHYDTPPMSSGPGCEGGSDGGNACGG